MNKAETDRAEEPRLKILLVDDEDQFRTALSRQLSVRGFQVLDVGNGEDAIKTVRHQKPEVVILDQNMPGMDGIQTLKEIKRVRPEVQVIMLTGHGSTESATISGKNRVSFYLEKPCGIDELIAVIEAAEEERVHALARHEIPDVKRTTLGQWLIGAHHARPGVIILGLVLFAAITLAPVSGNLRSLLVSEKTGQLGEKIAGYADYRGMKPGQNISEYYCKKAGWHGELKEGDGSVSKVPFSADQVGFRAKVMVAVVVLAALFWATGAIPIGITALLVGVVMCFFGVLPPDLVPRRTPRIR